MNLKLCLRLTQLANLQLDRTEKGARRKGGCRDLKSETKVGVLLMTTESKELYATRIDDLDEMDKITKKDSK